MKYMFNYKKVFIGLMGIILLNASCTKDFLAPDFSVSSAFTQDAVFKTWVEAEKVLGAAYGYLQNYSGFNMRVGSNRSGTSYLAAYTDEATNSFIWTGSWNVTNGTFNQYYNPDDVWNVSYQGIRRCNMYLENIDKVTDIDAATILRTKMEARGLRAFYYFELFKRYGGVPLVTNVMSTAGVLSGNTDDYNQPRKTVDETVQFIKNELDTVTKYLPPPTPASAASVGRMNRAISVALKGRLMLYYASPLHNPAKLTARWQDAALANKQAIDTATKYGAALFNNYQTLFTSASRSASEIIWFVFQNCGCSLDTYEGMPSLAYGGTNPTLNHIDKYEMRTTGKAIYDAGSGYDPTNPYLNRDPRLGLSVIQAGELFRGFNYAPWWGPGGADSRSTYSKKISDGSWTGMVFKKFMDPGAAANRNWPLIRLAELYLNYAEALTEGNPTTQAAAFAAVNTVRARAGVAMPAIAISISKDSLVKRIRNERDVELAFEEHRNFDARRWKTAAKDFAGNMWGFRVLYDDTTKKYSFPRYAFQVRKYLPHWDLYPIPQAEIDKSKGKLVQNPGY